VDLLNLGDGIVVLLVMVLVVSIVAGSLLMLAVSLLLLAIFCGLAYRAHTIRRNLDPD
jgi:FtsH-binding integral membrane protein